MGLYIDLVRFHLKLSHLNNELENLKYWTSGEFRAGIASIKATGYKGNTYQISSGKNWNSL